MAGKRPTYDDQFRASSVVMLQAAGWPEQIGALERVAKHLHIPARTLARWARGEQNPPPDRLVAEKQGELSQLFEAELRAIFRALETKREEAGYRDLGIVLGILADKWQLLNDQPTDRNETTIRYERRGLSSLHERAASGPTPGGA